MIDFVEEVIMTKHEQKNGMIIRWRYRTYLNLEENIEKITLYQEVNLKIDNDKVFAFHGEFLLGRVRNNPLEIAFLSFSNNSKYHIESKITEIDTIGQTIEIESIFFREVNVEMDGIVKKYHYQLIKCNKWALNPNKTDVYPYGSFPIRIGSEVKIDRDPRTDYGYLVKNQGYGIGELNEKSTNEYIKIRDSILTIKLKDITHSNTGSLGAVITIYCIDKIEEKENEEM